MSTGYYWLACGLVVNTCFFQTTVHPSQSLILVSTLLAPWSAHRPNTNPASWKMIPTGRVRQVVIGWPQMGHIPISSHPGNKNLPSCQFSGKWEKKCLSIISESKTKKNPLRSNYCIQYDKRPVGEGVVQGKLVGIYFRLGSGVFEGSQSSR